MRPKGSRLSSKPGARARAWKSMRILKTFTHADLMITAEIRHQNVKMFVKALLDAGYLKLTKPPMRGHWSTYRLVRDTGPQCPIPWKNGEVLDQNTRTIYGKDGVIVIPTGEGPKP